MRKLSIGACLFFLGLAGTASANPVNTNTALTAAQKFYAYKTGIAAPELHLAGTYTTEKGDMPTVYIFEQQTGNGFVIIAAEDRVQPILAYSTESRFYAADGSFSPEANYWVDLYSKQIEYAMMNELSPSADINSQWDMWTNPTTVGRPTALSAPVAPMLATTWDQAPYYNYLCPAGTPTGCVATAMAQIMKFWDYPNQGTGQHSYSSSTVGGTLSADFGATTYDWANMPATLTMTSPTAKKTAIATLMFHCGVGVEMDYTTSSSGAQVILGTFSAKTAYTNFFNYKSTIKGYKREDFYSDYTWHRMLMFEINTGRPLLYAGFGTSGGHAFVFDGYDETEMFHVNWGWGGMSNGYFEVNSLNPSALGTGGGGGNFNFNQQALIMIEPPSSTLTANPWNRTSDNTTAISSVEVNNQFLLYPNPATQTVNIDARKYNGKISGYSVYNTFGQQQLAQQTTGNQFRINTANLSSGLYYIQIQTTDGIVTKPVSIAK